MGVYLRSFSGNFYKSFWTFAKFSNHYLFDRTGTIFSRRYKQPKEVNYRQIEKDILDEVMGPKVVL